MPGNGNALADMLLFDTTGIEIYVAENNPKFPRTKAGETFEFSGAAASNPQVKLQYINGHMCYAQRAVVIINGLGIVRYLELFDKDFRQEHSEIPLIIGGNPPFAEHIRRLFQQLISYLQINTLISSIFSSSLL